MNTWLCANQGQQASSSSAMLQQVPQEITESQTAEGLLISFQAEGSRLSL